MASDKDITSANASAVLIVDDLFPAGIELKQFAADTAISADAVQIAETRMGVDGHMAAGMTPNIYPVTINLEANSPTRASLCAVFEAQTQNREIYECTLTVKLKSTDETYQFTGGVLKSANPMPSLAKILGPSAWQFDFEKMERI